MQSDKTIKGHLTMLRRKTGTGLKRKVKKAARDLKSDALADSVLRVVAAYVAHHGGKVVVAGPIQLQRWPSEGEFRFTIGVPCSGRPPKVAAKRELQGEIK